MKPLKYNVLLEYFIRIVSAILVLYYIGFMVWTIFYTETGNGDNVEHLHSTWLISQGKIPYKDFFQHHNPLLWFVFSPFIDLPKNYFAILDTAHTIGILGGLITFVYVYKISSTFFAGKISSIVSLLILCPAYFYIYCFNFNPDTFMALFYAVGLYYLFLYWEKQKFCSLCVSFYCFFLSFMFTQKVLLVLGVLGVISLFVFYRKKSPLSDIVFSLLLPLMSLCVFLAYLYVNDILEIYWKSNYLFNIEMQQYYGNIKTSVVDRKFLEPAFCLAGISILSLFIKSNLYFRVISIMFVIEILERYFYFSIAPYYMLPLMIYTVLLNSVIIDRLIKFRKEIVLVFLCLATYYSYVSKDKYLSVRGTNRGFVSYLNSNITPCDYVLSGFLSVLSIKNKDMHYYWALLGHIDIAGEKMGLHPKPNVTELVVQYLPKLVFGGHYYDNYYYNRDRTVFVQSVDKKVLDKYYLPTEYKDYHILKPEYRKYECVYDKNRGEWYYAD